VVTFSPRGSKTDPHVLKVRLGRFAVAYTGREGNRKICEAGCWEDVMFSKASRTREHLELIYSGDHFIWREDESVAASRLGDRKRRILATCIAIALTAIVLGQSFGVAWLLTAAASTGAVLP
jgi:hypothetical protein